jgi:hypothetical protein
MKHRAARHLSQLSRGRLRDEAKYSQEEVPGTIPENPEEFERNGKKAQPAKVQLT